MMQANLKAHYSTRVSSLQERGREGRMCHPKSRQQQQTATMVLQATFHPATKTACDPACSPQLLTSLGRCVLQLYDNCLIRLLHCAAILHLQPPHSHQPTAAAICRCCGTLLGLERTPGDAPSARHAPAVNIDL
jgi:hypothetical protein